MFFLSVFIVLFIQPCCVNRSLFLIRHREQESILTINGQEWWLGPIQSIPWHTHQSLTCLDRRNSTRWRNMQTPYNPHKLITASIVIHTMVLLHYLYISKELTARRPNLFTGSVLFLLLWLITLNARDPRDHNKKFPHIWIQVHI